MWTKYTQSLATSTVTALQHRAAVHDWLIHWWVHNRSCWSQVKLKWLQQTPPEHSRVISHQLWIIRPPSELVSQYIWRQTYFVCEYFCTTGQRPRVPLLPPHREHNGLITGSRRTNTGWAPGTGQDNAGQEGYYCITPWSEIRGVRLFSRASNEPSLSLEKQEGLY